VALRTIDRALPALRRFAVSLQPALRVAPPALESGRSALLQLRRLTQPTELRGLLQDLRPAVRAADPTVRRLRATTTGLTPVARCVSRNVVGTLNRTLPDGHLSTGRPVWQEMLQMGAALASFSNSFDGNGTAFRAGVAGGETALVAQMPGGSTAYGLGDIVGVAPQPLRSLSALPYRPDATCDQQPLPDLGKRRSTELPKGLTRVAARTAPAGSASLLEALVRHDRSGALNALRRLFPRTDRPTSGSRGARRRPTTKPTPPPPRTDSTRRPAPTLPEPVEQLAAPLVDVLRDVVDALPILGSRR
jgi:hypothetical protein